MSRGFSQSILAAVAAVAISSSALAQSIGTLSGRVTDRATQRPLESVQVRIVGSTRGALTDATGTYRIVNVPVGVTQVAANRIGYGAQSRTVSVSDGVTTTLDFALAMAATTLDQVTVTATGETSRARENGAATSVIDSAAFNKATISTFSDALSSRAPGVVVQTASGETGAGSRIRIRGSNSISLSNDPLLIVDGIRVDNSSRSTFVGTGGQEPSRFNDINPEEIESIEIIKGPAAASLYGTAASNGVIQVTTKKGRAGKTKWDAFAESGVLHDANEYPLNYRSFGHTALNGFVQNCNLGRRTSGLASACVAVDSVATNIPLEAADILQDGSRRLAGLSAAGGSDVVTYFMSGEYSKEQNVIPVNAQQRMNMRVNVRGQLAKALDAQVSIGFVNSDLRRPQNDNNSYGVISGSMLGKAVDCGPGTNTKHPGLCGSDTLSRGYYNPGISPYDFFNINTRQQVQRLIGGVTTNWTPLSWLAVNGTFGADLNQRNDNETLQPNVLLVDQTAAEGYRGVYRSVVHNYTSALNATGTYEYSPTVKFTTTGGLQFTDVGFTRTDAFGAKLVTGSGSLAGTAARFSVGEQTEAVKTLGFLAREQMAWRDRVFLTAGVRTDRNSAFGVNYARIYYPSVSASWVVSEESYFPKLASLSSFRLRTALGSAGQNPGYLAAEQYFTPVSVALKDDGEVTAVTVGSVGNPGLKPEKTTEFEGGFDVGLFSDRLNVEYTYYNKVTKDALVNVDLAPSLGSSTNRYRNLGQVSNRGNELLMRAAVFDGRQVKFDLTVSGAWTRNRLDTLGTDAQGRPIPPFTSGFDNIQAYRNGLPLGSYYARALTGVNDANHDGLIACPNGPDSTGCEYTIAAEPSDLGSPFPRTEISVLPSLSFGRFVRVSATFDHRGGQKLYNSTSQFRTLLQTAPGWQNPSASNLFDQAVSQAAFFGEYGGYVENSSFTKLREVAVTLTVPQQIAARAGAAAATLTLAGRNLKTWTNYSGLDPEVSANSQFNFSTADFLTAPPVRFFTARLALSF